MLSWSRQEQTLNKYILRDTKSGGRGSEVFNKVYRERHPHRGVVLLRLEDERVGNKMEVLKRLPEQCGEETEGRFVVVAERGVRFGR